MIKTFSGLLFGFQLASQDDQPALKEFWQRVSRKSVSARYLGMEDPTQPSWSNSSGDEAKESTSTFLALGGEERVIAITILVVDQGQRTARVMVFTRDEITSHGVSWALLARVLTEAQGKGVMTVSSILSAEDLAIKLETRMGFAESAYPGVENLRRLQWTFHPSGFSQAEAAP